MARNETMPEGSDLQTREKQPLQQEGTRPGPIFRPDVDIVETAEEFLVSADLPGVDESHVSVRLEEGVLSIEGTLAVEPDPGWSPLHAEYRTGGYHREFRISDAIDSEKIRASMHEGVLELRLPKADRHRPRQITVQAG